MLEIRGFTQHSRLAQHSESCGWDKRHCSLVRGVFPKTIILGFLLPIDYTLCCETGMREGLDGSGYGRLFLLKSSTCIPLSILDSRRQKSPFQNRKQPRHRNTTGEIQLLHSSNSCKRHVHVSEILL